MNTANAKLIPLPAPEEEITPLTVVADVDTVIAEAKAHAEQAAKHLRSSVEHALLAGLRIWWLHKNTAAQGVRNDFLPHGTKLGFEAAIDQIGIPLRTAYRWKNAAHHAIVRAHTEGLIQLVPDTIPEPSSAEFSDIEEAIARVAQNTSLRRLMLGASNEKTEEHRYHDLIQAEEAGDLTAEEILEKVEYGELSLELAIKALGGAKATKGKSRRDPVYFGINNKGKVTGLFSKCLITLETGFNREFTRMQDAEQRNVVLNRWRVFLAKIDAIITATEEAAQ